MVLVLGGGGAGGEKQNQRQQKKKKKGINCSERGNCWVWGGGGGYWVEN